MKSGCSLSAGRQYLLFALVALPTACTNVYRFPVYRAEMPVGERMDLRVALELPNELRTAELRWDHMLDVAWNKTTLIPLGDTLTANCRRLARAVFSQVEVLEGAVEEEDANRMGADAILIPRVVMIKHTSQATLLSWTLTMTIALEWEVRRPSGQVVWVETVAGQGSAYAGGGGSGKRETEKRIGLTVQDLFDRSFGEISSSREVRAYAAEISAHSRGESTGLSGGAPVPEPD